MTKQLNVLGKKTRFIDFNFIFIKKTKNDYIDNSFTMMLQCQSCRSFVRFLRIDWSFPLPPFRHCFVIFFINLPPFPLCFVIIFFFINLFFFSIYFFSSFFMGNSILFLFFTNYFFSQVFFFKFPFYIVRY